MLDVEGYTFSQGTIDNGTQESVLNISSVTLQSLESSSIFGCVVQSSVYPDSSSSVTRNMTLETLIFGKNEWDYEILSYQLLII